MSKTPVFCSKTDVCCVFPALMLICVSSLWGRRQVTNVSIFHDSHIVLLSWPQQNTSAAGYEWLHKCQPNNRGGGTEELYPYSGKYESKAGKLSSGNSGHFPLQSWKNRDEIFGCHFQVVTPPTLWDMSSTANFVLLRLRTAKFRTKISQLDCCNDPCL